MPYDNAVESAKYNALNAPLGLQERHDSRFIAVDLCTRFFFRLETTTVELTKSAQSRS